MKGIDLFCGCGGLSMGLQKAGVQVLAAYDNWQPAIACYRENFAHAAHQADLTDVDNIAKAISAAAPDIIAGGPPCQDFSSAGKRTEKENANLTLCFAGIIAAVKPKWFLMENVDRAQSSRTYRAARKIFKGLNYGLTEQVLNASYYHVPQNRRRFFCIGLLNAKDGFLSDDLLLAREASSMTIKEYFNAIREPIKIDSYYRHPRSYARRAVFSVDEPSPTIRGVNRPVPGGYQGHSGDKKDPKKVRPLTTRERSLIQTFPPDFKLPGQKSAAEQLLGNAVPVNLAAAVAEAIMAYDAISQQPAGRGRKSAKDSLYDVDRDTYMRFLLREGYNQKYAKDSWSWLQHATPYLDESQLDRDNDEIMYKFSSDFSRHSGKNANLSRAKKSLSHFLALHDHLKNSKNLDLFG